MNETDNQVDANTMYIHGSRCGLLHEFINMPTILVAITGLICLIRILWNMHVGKSYGHLAVSLCIISIGFAILCVCNTVCYILDKRNDICKIQVPDEIKHTCKPNTKLEKYLEEECAYDISEDIKIVNRM